MEEKRRPYNTRNDAKRGNTKKTNNTTKSYLRRILIVPNRICTNVSRLRSFAGAQLLLLLLLLFPAGSGRRRNGQLLQVFHEHLQADVVRQHGRSAVLDKRNPSVGRQFISNPTKLQRNQRLTPSCNLTNKKKRFAMQNTFLVQF